MKLFHVVGARPNFMKLAPLRRAIHDHAELEQAVVHTGQHYDFNMSDVFFQQLGMSQPEINLGVGAGSHAQQTAEIMSKFEPVLLQEKPDWVVVYGDVNSTLAATLVCAKLSIPVAHVESGLRSFDREMPEEINRLVTDQLSSLLFTPSEDADRNLLAEGIPNDRIRLVGNIMIDTLVKMLPNCDEFMPKEVSRPYALVTMHRPSNVDDPQWFSAFVEILQSLSKQLQIVFPLHPRTRAQIKRSDIQPERGVTWMEPVSYMEFLALQKNAMLVITDSGGIQEETTYLGVPCLTMRKNTERPVTVELGTNLLIGRDLQRLRREFENVLSGNVKKGKIPRLWDGKTGARIADVFLELVAAKTSTSAVEVPQN
jgi:UDP-N-acetylglucosamine 2-epimerase (non-hydrolysing)